MTLTVPTVNRARSVMFLAGGPGKSEMVKRLVARDAGIPTSRVRPDATLLIDEPAASDL